MEDKQGFTYRYSAGPSKEIERIRKKYLPKEESKLDTLRQLDNRVQTAGIMQGLTVGIIGSLVFGIGMCFGLDVFGTADWISVLFCAVGAAIMLPAYPVYKFISKKTKEKLTPEIIRLADELIKS